MYSVLYGDEGTEREAFAAMCFGQANCTVEASRDETSGDFAITFDEKSYGKKILVEVGGKNKKEKSADFVLRDNTDYLALNAIPFWLLAMLW